MADWRKIAQINGDVVTFNYTEPSVMKEASLAFVWDVDKTYLDTNISTLSGLWHTIREKAFQKKNIPGTATLIRALKETYAGQTDRLPLYFITASPPQMESRIRAKLSLDKISPYGAFFKDNLKNLKPNRFRRLTQQIGFKLQAILQLRTMLHANVQQILWGDDTESDALIYSLYSDICAKRIQSDELSKLLESLSVLPSQVRTILELAEIIPVNDPVQRVYINLAMDTDPDYYIKFGRRMLPTYNTFQVALDLFQDNKITDKILLNIAQVLIATYNFTKEEIFWSIEDLIQREILKQETTKKIMDLLELNGIILNYFSFTQKTKKIMEAPSKISEWIPTKIDYLNDYR